MPVKAGGLFTARLFASDQQVKFFGFWVQICSVVHLLSCASLVCEPSQGCMRDQRYQKRDGSFFCPNSQPLHAIQIDSAWYRPPSSFFALTSSAISRTRGSSRSQGSRLITSSTCRMSYQISGVLSLAKSAPIPKRYGLRVLRCSHRPRMVSAPILQASPSRHLVDCASAFSVTKFAYGQGSSLRPGPRNLPNPLAAAHGQPFSRTRLTSWPAAVPMRGSVPRPNFNKAYRVAGASQSIHCHSSSPLPPKHVGILTMI